jgi:hypothetical protein
MTTLEPTLRERLIETLRAAAYVCPGDECPHSEDECGENEPIVMAVAVVIDGVQEATYIDGEVTALADAVLPVVEAWAAEQTHGAVDARHDAEYWRLRAEQAEAAAAEQTQRADTWTVTVEVPMALPDEAKDSLFTAVADAVHDWEPADRDGWDAMVGAGRTVHDLRYQLAEERVERIRAALDSAKQCQDSLDPSERARCAMCGGDHFRGIQAALSQPEESL